MRKEPDDRAEMVSQLLFGEFALLLESRKSWFKIRSVFDHYEGWIDPKMVCQVERRLSSACAPVAFVNQDWLKIKVTNPFGDYTMNLGFGTPLPFFPDYNSAEAYHLTLGVEDFELPQGTFSKPLKPNPESIVETSLKYIGVPYLWGGRSISGIDCSGLTQSIMRLCGISLPRDASQQVNVGESISWDERKSGDLAFFQNKEGKVTHVGVITSLNEITHASGRVRVDRLNEKGIENVEDKKMSHVLHAINRYK